MNAILLLTAAIDALTKGAQLFAVVDSLNAVSERMQGENRAEPTDADLDAFWERIAARQARIDAA